MHLPSLMGILNITPDSFSDGTELAPQTFLNRAQSLLEDGADIIDVGAESTRPGATPLTPDQEWQRLSALLPQIITYTHNKGRKVSLDTRHPQTAAKALGIGVDILNDVSGFTNPHMIEIAAASNCDLICMHSLTIPADKSVTLAEDADAINELTHFFQQQLNLLTNAGIDKRRITLDPGLGFAKTAEQSLEIIERLDELKPLGCPLLIGHSRKSFLGKPNHKLPEQRDALTLVLSQYLLAKEVGVLRIHNVKLHKQLLELATRPYA